MLSPRPLQRFDGLGIDAKSPASAAAAPLPLFAGAVVHLDEDALERLRQLDPTGANQLLKRVFDAFESSAGRLLPQLREAQRRGDPLGIRHVAHTLKSSSASIGATRLSQLCADVETQVGLGTLLDIPERVGQMEFETGRVIEALKRLPGSAT